MSTEVQFLDPALNSSFLPMHTLGVVVLAQLVGFLTLMLETGSHSWILDLILVQSWSPQALWGMNQQMGTLSVC